MMNYEVVTINNLTAVKFGGEYLVNLTPHDITIVIGDETVNIPASGSLARVSSKTVRDGRTFCGIPVSCTVYGQVEGLPAPTEGVGYIVSGLVKARCPERVDVFAPSETIRNEKGQVAGATSLGI